MSEDTAESSRLIRFYTLSAASVVLLYLAFHPVDMSLLAWFALVPVLYATTGIEKLRHVFLYASATGFLFHLIGLAWLALCTPPGWVVTVFLEALYFGLSAVLVTYTHRRTGLPYFVVLAPIWAALDFERARYKFFAFPWLILGQTQHGQDTLLQIADIGSFYIVDFLVIMGNGLILDGLRHLRPFGLWDGLEEFSPVATKDWLFKGSGVFVALILASLLYGTVRKGQVEKAMVEGPTMLCIQSDFPSRLDRDPIPSTVVATQSLSLTNIETAKAAKANLQYDFIVWPETTWPYPINKDYPDRQKFRANFIDRLPLSRRAQIYLESERLMRLPEDHKSDILVGAINYDYGVDRLIPRHNSVFRLSADPEKGVSDRYDKVNLVPASEGIPGKDSLLFHWFYSLVKSLVPPAFTPFDPGEGAKIFEIKGRRIAPNVCFDVSYPHFIREATLAGAEVHVNVSNYSWFRSSQALDLANVQGKFRAIESRRAVVKVVNSGPTTAFDALGRVTAQLEHKAEKNKGSLLAATKTSEMGTFYTSFGDVFAWMLVLASCGLLAFAWRQSPEKQGLESKIVG